MKSNVTVPLLVLITSLLIILISKPDILISSYISYNSDFKSKAENFDFYIFAQQWPGSYKKTHRRCYPKEGPESFLDTSQGSRRLVRENTTANFTIHGLWPSCNEENCKPKKNCWPAYCNCGSRLNVSEIKDLKKKLEKNWPDLSLEKNDTKFWEGQWKKHGTCSNLNQHTYFEESLKLKDHFNLLETLEIRGIIPNNTSYPASDIFNAIKDKTHAEPQIKCSRKGQTYQLYEIYQCVTIQFKVTNSKSSTFEFINCPNDTEWRSCNGPNTNISFPASI